MLKPNHQIIKPQPVGPAGTFFHIGKSLDGDFVFTINNEKMVMSPQQAFDLAQRLFVALGFQPEFGDAQLGGPKLDG
jgi:hypothetical protein